MWWVDGFTTPPLISSSNPGTARGNAGILGLPSTQILFGNDTVTDGFRSGGRATFDYWLAPDRSSGIEFIYTGMAKQSSSFSVDSSQNNILARPFFNIEQANLGQDAELIAFPGLLTGNALVEASSSWQNLELLFRRNLCSNCLDRIDMLMGFRYGRLNESLHVSDFKRVTGSGLGLAVGTTLSEADWFDTKNEFNGFELGFITERRCRRWSFELLTKIAIGNNRSEVAINGNAQFTVPQPGGLPTTTNTPAGLLAQETNIGVFSRDDLAVIPEIGLTAGYDVTPDLRASLGYTFIYWSRVARPGDQIDTLLNLTQLEGPLVGPRRPVPNQFLRDIYAQGLRFGLDARF